jgi:broad specificity phosphatase PhoE
VTVFLLRHGETDWNREPARCQGWAEVPLNETGREQARAMARALPAPPAPPIDLIVTSHLARARETAEIVRAELAGIGGGTAPDLVVDERLAETRRGAWETRLFSEIIADEPEAWRAYREHPETFRFPEGESLAEQQRRVLRALGDAARTGRVALLVTHGGSMRLVGCFLEDRGIDAFHHVAIPEGGLLTLDDDDLAEHIDAFLGLAGDPGARVVRTPAGGAGAACEPHG